MNFGLITYKKTDNIGDDIQSYAAKRFLPTVDYYIEREELDEFLPRKKEEVAVIMNGWYMHNKQNFPPSEYIIPHLVSMYFSIGNNWTIEKSEYLKKYSKDYLNKYGPVGARDFVTLERLKELGIDSYFSGCMTLTLKKFDDVVKKDYICSVDLGVEKNDKLRKYYEGKNQEIIYVAQALDPEKNSRLSYEQRFNNVEKLLKLYQGAKAVITTRLHCALPCLALGVPVILIYNEDSYDRLGSFSKLMTMFSEKEFKNYDGELNYSINQEEIDKIRNPLIKSCEEFIENVKIKKQNIDLLDPDEYRKINKLDIIKWKKDIMSLEIKDLEKDIKWFKEKISELEKENNVSTNKIKELEKELKLEKEKNEYSKKGIKYNLRKIKNKFFN